jgi:hypothetical protein
MSRWFNLDTSSVETYFRRPNLGVLQVACAYFRYACELVATGARDDVYPGLRASDPLSALIESERDISGVEPTIAGLFPVTVRAPLSTGWVSPLRKKVPSDEKVRRFFPTPAGRLAVTIHAPTKPELVSPIGRGDAQAARSRVVSTVKRARDLALYMLSSFVVVVDTNVRASGSANRDCRLATELGLRNKVTGAERTARKRRPRNVLVDRVVRPTLL